MAHVEGSVGGGGGAGRVRAALTAEQRRIVEFGDGPAVVIAGAGTGKTRVIVERVRWLLETKGGPGATTDPPGANDALLPEQILVLTYNVKAARELGERLEAALGPAVKARLAVSNFHSFCHRVLADHPAEAGLRPDPDVLDGVGQVLLLRDIRPSLDLVYHSGKGNPNWWLPQFVGFINRAKDELVTPDEMDAFVDGQVPRNLVRYDNSAHHRHPDPHHRHRYDANGQEILPPEHVGEAGWPTLGDVIEEAYALWRPGG